MNIVRDLTTSMSGDLQLSANGDIYLGDSFETVKSAVNFIIKTDRGGYKPDSTVGGDLGRAIGENLTSDTLRTMERSLKENINKHILNPSDFQVHAIPVDNETVGVFVAVGGEYLDDDGNILDIDPEVISYAFPYYHGNSDPTPAAE